MIRTMAMRRRKNAKTEIDHLQVADMLKQLLVRLFSVAFFERKNDTMRFNMFCPEIGLSVVCFGCFVVRVTDLLLVLFGFFRNQM